MGNQLCNNTNALEQHQNGFNYMVKANKDTAVIKNQTKKDNYSAFQDSQHIEHQANKTGFSTHQQDNTVINMAAHALQFYLKNTQAKIQQQKRAIEQQIPFQVIKLTLSQSLCKIIYLLRNDLFKNLQRKQEQKNGKWKLNTKGAYIMKIKEEQVHIFTQKSYYEGSYISENHRYKPHLSGIFINQQGIYQGQFQNGLANGKGSFYYPQSQSQYKGQWEKGQIKHGIFQNKLIKYSGDFKNGVFQGKGKICFKFQDKSYQGLFKNGNYEDQYAILKCPDYTFTGGFKNSKKNGYGELIQEQKVVDKKIGGNRTTKIFMPQMRLKGVWKDDKMLKPVPI